jgi:hypothetical protein
MKLKTLVVAFALAFPMAAYAAGDKASSASSGDTKSSGSASAGATKNDGGAEAMFKSLDKNKDGSISKDEAKGTPHDKEFATLDKNHDGKLSREEHAAAPEHAGKASAGATSSSSGSSGSSGSSSGKSSKY